MKDRSYEMTMSMKIPTNVNVADTSFHRRLVAKLKELYPLGEGRGGRKWREIGGGNVQRRWRRHVQDDVEVYVSILSPCTF